MPDVFGFLGRVLRGTFALVLWLLAAGIALGLILVALVLLAVGALWALLRGRRPTRPVFVTRVQRFTRSRVWPGGSSAEVVDVETREVPDPRIDR
jgi:high-affinity Fe2+/Pb2+ permease